MMNIRSRVRAMSRALVLMVVAAICTGCIVTRAPVYPGEWAPITVGEENECPDLGGTFSASGDESGAITLLWFLPIWASSNKQSISRLDKVLALAPLKYGHSVEIEGTAALLLDHLDPDHLRIAVLRDDRHRVEGLGDVTYARSSSRLEDRAREFECRDGRIEFGYMWGREGGAESWTIRAGRSSDGALVVEVSSFGFAYLIFASGSAWHRFEALPDLQITPHLPEAPP